MAFKFSFPLRTVPHRTSRLSLGRIFFLSSLLLLALLGTELQDYLIEDRRNLLFFRDTLENPVARSIVLKEFTEGVRSHVSQVLEGEPAPADSTLPRIDVFLDPSDLDAERHERSTVRPATEASDYFPEESLKAFYSEGKSGLIECEFEMRGLSGWHHREEKPSIRLRFSKKGPALGFRWLELSGPEDPWDLGNWLPDELARGMGLMSGLKSHVVLYLNKKSKGVYIRSLRPAERLALENGRLPGTWVKGDRLDMGDIWSYPEVWDIRGEETPESRAWLNQFLQLVAEIPNHVARRGELARYLDEDSFAKTVALYVYAATTHADDRHNQLFFHSSYHGTFEFVPWDVNAWGIHEPVTIHPNVRQNRLVDLAYRDPAFIYARDRHLYELLQKEEQTIATATELFKRLEPELQADPGLQRLQRRTLSDTADTRRLEPMLTDRNLAVELAVGDLEGLQAELLDWIRERGRYLGSYLNEARVSVVGGVVSVHGNVAVKAVPQGDESKAVLLFPVYGFGKNELGDAILIPGPAFYQLPNPQTWAFSNAVTGVPLTPGAEQLQPVAQPFTPQLPPQPVEKPVEKITLGPGPLSVTKDVEFPPNSVVVIQPGTDLKLGPDVSLSFRGQLLMEGTENKPITVSRLEPGAPFGTFSILGEKSAGSRLRYVTMEGGSRAFKAGFDLKGMFNVYECPDFTMSDCLFQNNTRGDDTVNLAVSKVSVERCRFRGAPMDALDLDGCSGVVRDCMFSDNGNDGLDIMECDLEVYDCEFVNCGDKGISIGEECRTLIERAKITGCATGLELKDGSRTLVRDTAFERCQMAVRSYRKKWLFRTAGYGKLEECRFLSCAQDLDVDRYGRIWLEDSEPRVSQATGMRVSRDGVFFLGDGPSVRP